MDPNLLSRLVQLDTPIGKVWSIRGDIEHAGVINEVIVGDTYRIKELAEHGFNPDVIVDLGANIGTFTLMASYYFPKAAIYSFEPNYGHFQFLSLNCASKSTVMRSAVLGYPAKSKSYRGEELQWMKANGSAIGVSSMIGIVGTPDLIKMDVEGSEENILLEMLEIGVADLVPVIVGEWHHLPARKTVEVVLGLTHDVTFGPADRGYDWDTFHAFHRKRFPDSNKALGLNS